MMARPQCIALLVVVGMLGFAVGGCGSSAPQQDVRPEPAAATNGNGNGHAESELEQIATIQREPFGETPEGAEVDLYLLANKHGLKVEITNFGATVTSVSAPDIDGNFDEITLGFDDLEGYLSNAPYFGIIAGRFANRIANGHFRWMDPSTRSRPTTSPTTYTGGSADLEKWCGKPSQSTRARRRRSCIS